MKAQTILIPYLAGTAKAEELKFAVRSIAKHIKGDYDLVIIGDKPEWLSDEAIHIPHKQATGAGVSLPKCNDAWSKLKTAINSGLINKVFLYTYDDIIFLQDVENLEDLRTLYAEEDLHKVERFNEDARVAKHIGMIKKTVAELAKRGLPAWNYETHLPKVLNGPRVLRIDREFNGHKNRLLLNLIYGNYYYKGLEPQLLAKGDKVKVAYDGGKKSYSNKSKTGIEKALDGAKFLNYNDVGFNQHLYEVIQELFPEKCKYEV